MWALQAAVAVLVVSSLAKLQGSPSLLRSLRTTSELLPEAVLSPFVGAGILPPTGPVVLRYFDARGRAEAIRFALATEGIAFEDASFTGAEWGRDGKPGGIKHRLVSQGKLAFGQVPLLEIDGRSIVQSHAILRYLSRRHGWLWGESEEVRTMADVVALGTEDIRGKISKIKYSTCLSDEEKGTKLGEWLSDDDQGYAWFAKIEALIEKSPTKCKSRRGRRLLARKKRKKHASLPTRTHARTLSTLVVIAACPSPCPSSSLSLSLRSRRCRRCWVCSRHNCRLPSPLPP